MEWQIYINAFIVGGLICTGAQLVLDSTKLTPGHILVGLTVLGGILGGFGVYDSLIEFAGGGATMPISSFGNSLVNGAIMEAKRNGVLGVLTGMFELTSTGIAAAIIFSFFAAIIFNPKA